MGKKKFKGKPGASLEDRRKALREARREIAREAAGKKSQPKYTVEQLLEKAEDCIDRFEYELAQKFCQRALEIDPDNVQVLETTGTLLLELGNTESAKQCFGRAVEISPDKGHAKYMYLGQLFDGSQAAQCFQKGIELMIKEREQHQSQQQQEGACADLEGDISATDISNAFCSLAELYMTDCCFEENAEELCNSNIDKAIEIDPENPDAYQLKASYHLSKDQKEDAKEMINKSVSLWLPKYRAIDKGEVAEEDFDPVEPIPVTYESRMSASKILIEVGEYETAIEVLEGLLDENDEEPQTWYMIGWANYLHGDEYKGNARFYLAKSKEVFKKIKCKDEELLKHVEELLTETGPDEEENEEEDLVEKDMDDNNFESDSDDNAMEH